MSLNSNQFREISRILLPLLLEENPDIQKIKIQVENTFQEKYKIYDTLEIKMTLIEKLCEENKSRLATKKDFVKNLKALYSINPIKSESSASASTGKLNQENDYRIILDNNKMVGTNAENINIHGVKSPYVSSQNGIFENLSELEIEDTNGIFNITCNMFIAFLKEKLNSNKPNAVAKKNRIKNFLLKYAFDGKEDLYNQFCKACSGSEFSKKIESYEFFSFFKSNISKQIILNSFEHFRKFLNKSPKESRTDLTDENGNLIIKDYIRNNSGDSQIELISPLLYRLIPNSIKFYEKKQQKQINLYKLLAEIKSLEFKVFFKNESKSEDQDLNINKKTILEEKMVSKRFLNFLLYFSNQILIENEIITDQKKGLKITHISYDQINHFEDHKKCKLLNPDLVKILQKEFLNFTNNYISKPKGILFYGPPRTGKTFTCNIILDIFGLFKIYDSLSAADFSQGIVGQAEKMIDAITSRSELIPWELCVLYIDEIDSIVPNRNLSNTSSNQCSVIGQFLSVTDGNKKKPNLLIIATTNRLEQMDPAFNQRMDIKIFLGVPNFQARLQHFIKKLMGKFLKTHPFENLKLLQSIYFNEAVLERFKCLTVNFSADLMRKSIEKICLNAIHIMQSKNPEHEMKRNFYLGRPDKFIEENLIEICNNDRMFFGKFILPAVISDIPEKLIEDPEYKVFQSQVIEDIISAKKQNKNFLIFNYLKLYTKRILVDLSVQNIEDQFQLEIRHRALFNEFLRSIIISMKNSDSLDIRNHLVELIKSNIEIKMEHELQKLLDYLDTVYYETMMNLKETMQEQGETFIYNEKENSLNKNKRHILKFNEEFIKKIIELRETLTVKSLTKEIGFKSLHEILKILIKLALGINIDYILFLDYSYFTKKSIIEENKIIEELTQSIEEAKKYPQSMIIVDFDSLCNMSKEYSNQTEELMHAREFYNQFATDKEATFSEVCERKEVFNTLMNYFHECFEVPSEHWFIGIFSNVRLSSMFKEKTNWPETEYEKKLKSEAKEQLAEKICIRCRQSYNEKANKHGSCFKHESPFLYLEPEYSQMLSHFNKVSESSGFSLDTRLNLLKKCIPYEKKDILKKIQDNEINASEAKWLCCGKGLYENGETPDKHISQVYFQKSAS